MSRSNLYSTPDRFDIRHYENASQCPMEDVRKLRQICWPDIYGLGQSLDDKFDQVAQHWTAHLAGRLVAAARMTVHEDLIGVPEPHLFIHLFSLDLPRPIGYISRLVVDSCARGLGVAGTMDALRIEAARAKGCRSMVCNWTPQSGIHRKQQLQALGFVTLDEEIPHRDGVFGVSFVFGMTL